jgi:hypothetical protein
LGALWARLYQYHWNTSTRCKGGTMLQFFRFVVMRFIMAIVTLLIVTFIVFSLMELSPLDYSARHCQKDIG